MTLKRLSGVLAHPTSFPGRYGMGDLGVEARKFVDFLNLAKQALWQVLPLGPTSYGDSPYQSFSAFAGNHYLISPELLLQEGYLTKDDLTPPEFPEEKIDYGPVIKYKTKLLRKAYEGFSKKAKAAQKKAFLNFCVQNEEWLSDYSLFMAIKTKYIEERRAEYKTPELAAYAKENSKFLSEEQINDYYYGATWDSWPSELANRHPLALEKVSKKLEEDVNFHKFLQYEFYRQWTELREYANKKGVYIVGDLPIFAPYDSSDVWAKKKLFQLTNNRPTAVAGVPPDYFSESGQLWGNPLYDWEKHAAEGYEWWTKRIGASLKTADIVRIDHFRGFSEYWSVPYGEKTAINGRWVSGPGKSLFVAMQKTLGSKKDGGALPIIAEDLGIITEDVTKLRKATGLPGMAVLQFAFSPDAKGAYIPHNITDENTVIYTGTHDNNTAVGWYNEAPEKEKDYFRRYMNVSGDEISWDLIRLAWSSIARFAITPVQDLLSQDGESRMNLPGEPVGNWRYRFLSGQLTSEIAERLAYLTALFNREPETPKKRASVKKNKR